MTTTAARLFIPAEVQQAVALLCAPGQVFEARILDATTHKNPGYAYRASGYFNNAEDLVHELGQLKTAKGIYITLQPVNPDLLSRAVNRLRSSQQMKSDASTSDKNITQYRWLLIDIDADEAIRPAGISATDQEHEAALTHAGHVQETLRRMGWPAPVQADSGNGAHLLYRIDLARNQSDLVPRVLGGLADMFDVPGQLHIDQVVGNPSRICKLYGTLVCKGDHTPTRPHRFSHILNTPGQLETVPLATLEAMARPVQPAATRNTGGKDFDLEAWITHQALDVGEPRTWEGGKRWVFNVCPWNTEHTDHSAYLVQFPSGAIAAGCHHNGCSGKKWQDLRKMLEPGYTEKQEKKRTQQRPMEPIAARKTGEQLPDFFIEGQLRDQVARSLEVLASANAPNPRMFIYLSNLRKIERDEKKRPILLPIDRAALRNELSAAANFYAFKKHGDEFVPVEAQPPKDLADQLLALAPSQWPFPALKSIVEAPVLRPDGSILDAPGYDDSTQLYYVPAPGMERCRIPSRPTRADVDRAAAFIQDMFADFPFEGQADRANTIALLFTPFVRYAVRKDIQMALIDATNAGTGKGLIAAVVSIAATGSATTPMVAKKDDDEWRKAILTELLQSPRIVVIDNIRGVLESASLELMLTGGGLNERILGQSKSAKPKNEATWIATGNNLLIGGDLTRRCYRIRLISKTATPEERTDFKIPDLEQWTSDHRPELVAAILTIAQAWYAAGKPQPKETPALGTFTDWAKTIGGMLEYAGIYGFQGNRTELRSRNNEEAQEWEAFLEAWVATYGDTEKIATEVAHDIAAETDVLQIEPPANLLQNALPTYLKKALAEKPKSFPVTLALQLGKRAQTVYGMAGYRIEKGRDQHRCQNTWRVLQEVAGGLSAVRREKNDFSDMDSPVSYSPGSTNLLQPPASPLSGQKELRQNGTASSPASGSIGVSPDGDEIAIAGGSNCTDENLRDLATLRARLQAQQRKTGHNPLWIFINGQPSDWSTGVQLAVDAWIDRFTQLLSDPNPRTRVNAELALEERLTI